MLNVFESPLVEGEAEPVERDEAQSGAAHGGVGDVVLVVGLEDDDLVAGLHEGKHRRHHRFSRATGDRDLALGVDFEAVVPPDFLRDGVAETRIAPGDGVLVDVGRDRFDGGAFDEIGRGEIGEALGQVDRTVFEGEARHLADHRFGEDLGARGDEGAWGHARDPSRWSSTAHAGRATTLTKRVLVRARSGSRGPSSSRSRRTGRRRP